MHEFSIAESVVSSVAPQARANRADRVTVVRLRIGAMTDIVREALEFAWDVACEEQGDLFAGCKLEIEEIAPRSACMACGTEFDHDRFHPRCPSCGSGQTLVMRGRELDIASFDIETPDDGV